MEFQVVGFLGHGFTVLRDSIDISQARAARGQATMNHISFAGDVSNR